MKISIVTSADGVPLALYGDKRHGEAQRVANLVGGKIVGPLTLNRDIPPDVVAMYEFEMTGDGSVKRRAKHRLVDVLMAEREGRIMAPGWHLTESPRLWRLKVLAWSKSDEESLALAKAIYADVKAGRRQKSGTL